MCFKKDRTKCKEKTLFLQVVSPLKVNCDSATNITPSNSTCIYYENRKEKMWNQSINIWRIIYRRKLSIRQKLRIKY